MYKIFFKRLIDFVIALIALLCIGWFLIIIAIWLKLANKGAGAFFFQERSGKNGKIFKIVKFKTMTDEKDAQGNLLPDKYRLTKVGKFIRSTSLDELPQLWNMLVGDMALIGPRPLVEKYIPLYNKKHMKRHEVRPGITGWAQVNGRNKAKFSQKFDLDVWYVDHCSFKTDIKIVFLTMKKVFFREDIGEGGSEMGQVDDLQFAIRMVKFGSDYPIINDYKKGISVKQLYSNANYYASGRQALIDLISNNKWEKLWIPEYFCYDTLEGVKSTGIEIAFYKDYPGFDDNESIRKLKLKEGDVLLRINYFGMRDWRDEISFKIPVIEDHTHDLAGEWAMKSNADYCIASLRKCLPVCEGGMLWSPKKFALPKSPISTSENDRLASMRYEAMKQKRDFLDGNITDRRTFRRMYVESENMFATLPISKISMDSWNVVEELDIQDWNRRKKNNWEKLQCLKEEGVEILQPEKESLTPFSLILLFKTKQERDKVRTLLINRQTVYPAVLWRIPYEYGIACVDFGDRMLSIHVDGRYDNDLEELKNRIVTALKLAKL